MDWRERGAVSRQEAAEILGISSATIAELAKAGQLHEKRAGRKVLVAVYSIRKYLGEPVELAPIAVPASHERASVSPRARRILVEARHRLG